MDTKLHSQLRSHDIDRATWQTEYVRPRNWVPPDERVLSAPAQLRANQAAIGPARRASGETFSNPSFKSGIVIDFWLIKLESAQSD